VLKNKIPEKQPPKNVVVEMKIAFERLISRLEMSERRTNEINVKLIEMFQTEMQINK